MNAVTRNVIHLNGGIVPPVDTVNRAAVVLLWPAVIAMIIAGMWDRTAREATRGLFYHMRRDARRRREYRERVGAVIASCCWYGARH